MVLLAGHCNLVHGDLVHGDLVHGDLVHGDLVHGDLVHGDLVHGDLVAAEDSTHVGLSIVMRLTTVRLPVGIAESKQIRFLPVTSLTCEIDFLNQPCGSQHARLRRTH